MDGFAVISPAESERPKDAHVEDWDEIEQV